MLERNKRLGLYLHVPFCVKKCKYCDFLSAPATKTTRMEYIDALIREMEVKSSWLARGLKKHVNTIYIGGGTPSLLDIDEMERLVTKLNKSFRIKKERLLEFTIEVNPGTLNKAKLEAYYSLGANRISFGLQSVHVDELARLGRIHNYEEFVKNYQWAREVGFANVSVDLMSGLPNQTVDRLCESVQSVCGLQPEHVSAYSLILEPGTEFHDRYGKDSPVGEEVELAMDQTIKEMLDKHGYRQYEISNYAKRGYEAIHNQSYWEGVDYLGLGLGASSLINNTRYQNETDMENYLAWSKSSEEYHDLPYPYAEVHPLTKTEQMEEFLFLGLRMRKGVEESRFYQRFEETMEHIYGDVIRKWEKEGYMVREDGRIYLSDKGFAISNRIMADFI